MASKKSIEEFERDLGTATYNIPNEKNESRLPLGMIVLTVILFILLIIAILFLLGVY